MARLRALETVKKYFPKVTSVIDATEPITLTVFENDCKFGIESDPRSCAFARAAQREHNGALVGIRACYIVDGAVATRYQHNYSKLLKDFDKRIGTLRPGTIQLLCPTQRLGKAHRPGVRDGSAPHPKRRFIQTHEDRTGVRVL